MARYRHVQRARWAVVLAASMLVVALVLAVTAGIDGLGWLYVGIVIAAAAMLAVCRLTVEVDDAKVTVAFAPGWPRRTIARTDVAGVDPVRVGWRHGWGIRKVPSGWMYNISGFDAVQLRLTSGQVFWIGTDDVAGLVEALRRSP